MATYTFRCPEHGDFNVDQPMSETTRTAPCPFTALTAECSPESLKVLGGKLQFTWGREQFHDGPMGDGKTVRETQKEWLASAKANGLEVEGTGYRHI